LGIFSKNLKAEDVKKYIEPSINLASRAINHYQELDFDSENWLEQAQELTSLLYRYMGSSTHQAFELTELLKSGRISAVAMEAANKTFFMFYSNVDQIMFEINTNLRFKGLSYELAIEFHSECWKSAKNKLPTEMSTLEKVRNGKNSWDWINSESWALL
jgi:hypothetical protein